MKPVRHASLADAVPFQRGAGHRTPATLLLIDERDRYLIEAADRFCIGMKDRPAAHHIRTALLRYQTCAWRRDRADLTCPARHAGSLTAVLWMLLKVRDAIPSEPTIRRVLGAIREPDGMM
jgi:hypothetical protein